MQIHDRAALPTDYRPLGETSSLSLAFMFGGFSYGGGKRVIINVLRGLDADKYDLSLITIAKDGPMKNLLPPNIRHVPFIDPDLQHPFRFGRKLKGLRDIVQSLWKLGWLLRKEPPDILVSDTLVAHLLAYFGILFTRNQIVWVARKGILIRRDSRKGHRRFKDYWERWLFKFLYRQTTHVITPSIPVKEDVCKVLGLRTDKVSVIPNPVDVELVRRKSVLPSRTGIVHLDDYISAGRPFILFVGRLIKRKQVALLVDAMKFVEQSDIDARLVILGEGPERPYLQTKVEQLGLTGTVFLPGAADNPFYYMKKAKVMAFPAVREGFGYVVVEAMLCGCPVVALDVRGGPSQIITHMQTGYLIAPPYEAESLAAGIVTLVSNRSLSEQIRVKALEVAKEFNLDIVSRQYGQKLRYIYFEKRGK